MGATIAGCSISPTVGLLVAFAALMGLIYGALAPSLASMVGLEAPDFAKATVFGYSSSATALGMAAGPLAAGGVAAVTGLPAGLYLSAAVMIVVAVVMGAKGREPAAPLGPP